MYLRKWASCDTQRNLKAMKWNILKTPTQICSLYVEPLLKNSSYEFILMNLKDLNHHMPCWIKDICISGNPFQNKSIESELEPLHMKARDLEAQREALTTEKTALEMEVARWKMRTTHLIEQCNKADPEEIKRLT